jgi:hypothetical protein
MAIQVFALVAGLALLVALAVISMRGAGPPRSMREGKGAPMIPVGRQHHRDDDGGGDGAF